jgi:hypothetical protein
MQACILPKVYFRYLFMRGFKKLYCLIFFFVAPAILWINTHSLLSNMAAPFTTLPAYHKSLLPEITSHLYLF